MIHSCSNDLASFYVLFAKGCRLTRLRLMSFSLIGVDPTLFPLAKSAKSFAFAWSTHLQMIIRLAICDRNFEKSSVLPILPRRHGIDDFVIGILFDSGTGVTRAMALLSSHWLVPSLRTSLGTWGVQWNESISSVSFPSTRTTRTTQRTYFLDWIKFVIVWAHYLNATL